MITYQLCYGFGSKEHKIPNCNKKNNIFITINEEELRQTIEEYGGIKNVKLRFHTNNARSEAMICFSTEKQEQKPTPTKDGKQNCTKQSGSQENCDIEKIETKKPHNSNESSIKQVELSYL